MYLLHTESLQMAGAFLGGLITALIGIFALRITKDKNHSDLAVKLSEYRVAWIHKLRDTMSEFQSYAMTPGIDHSSERKFYELGTKIELLMNPQDDDYKKLSECQYRMLTAQTTIEKYRTNPEYVEVCQRILKREWEKVKSEAFAESQRRK